MTAELPSKEELDALEVKMRSWGKYGFPTNPSECSKAADAIAALRAALARAEQERDELDVYNDELLTRTERVRDLIRQRAQEIARLQTRLNASRLAADAMEAELEVAEAERDALKADAERYRWLRQCKAGQWEYLNNKVRVDLGMEALDTAVDGGIARDDSVPAELWFPNDAAREAGVRDAPTLIGVDGPARNMETAQMEHSEFDRRVYRKEYRGLLGCSDPWFRELKRRGRVRNGHRDPGGHREWWLASEVREDMARMTAESEPTAA